MRVVNVLAVGPDGEGEELGTVETLREAWRIGEPAGWYRIYSSKTICASEHIHELEQIYEYNDIHLSYAWDRERNLWVSDDGGAYGEPLTMPLADDADDPLFGATHFVHWIARLTDPPSRCARCDATLQPGADSWRAYGSGSDLVVCHDCARPPIWWDPKPRAGAGHEEPDGPRKHQRITKTAGYNADGTSWISPDDPLFGATHYFREVVSLADAPERCARCDTILQPGTYSWRASNSEGELGISCQDCGGRRPDLSSLPS